MESTQQINFKPSNMAFSLTNEDRLEPLLIISNEGNAKFLGVEFTREVVDSLLSGTSFIISRSNSGWMINNKLVEGVDIDIIVETAKNCLLNTNSISSMKLVETLRQFS